MRGPSARVACVIECQHAVDPLPCRSVTAEFISRPSALKIGPTIGSKIEPPLVLACAGSPFRGTRGGAECPSRGCAPAHGGSWSTNPLALLGVGFRLPCSISVDLVDPPHRPAVIPAVNYHTSAAKGPVSHGGGAGLCSTYSGGLHPAIQPHYRRRTPGAAVARCRHAPRRQRLGDPAQRSDAGGADLGGHRKGGPSPASPARVERIIRMARLGSRYYRSALLRLALLRGRAAGRRRAASSRLRECGFSSCSCGCGWMRGGSQPRSGEGMRRDDYCWFHCRVCGPIGD